jgi:hypothetical protein
MEDMEEPAQCGKRRDALFPLLLRSGFDAADHFVIDGSRLVPTRPNLYVSVWEQFALNRLVDSRSHGAITLDLSNELHCFFRLEHPGLFRIEHHAVGRTRVSGRSHPRAFQFATSRAEPKCQCVFPVSPGTDIRIFINDGAGRPVVALKAA